MNIIMRWIESLQMYYMLDGRNGKFLESFHDCPNIDRWFPDLDKTKDNHYTMIPAVKENI